MCAARKVLSTCIICARYIYAFEHKAFSRRQFAMHTAATSYMCIYLSLSYTYLVKCVHTKVETRICVYHRIWNYVYVYSFHHIHQAHIPFSYKHTKLIFLKPTTTTISFAWFINYFGYRVCACTSRGKRIKDAYLYTVVTIRCDFILSCNQRCLVHTPTIYPLGTHDGMLIWLRGHFLCIHQNVLCSMRGEYARVYNLVFHIKK